MQKHSTAWATPLQHWWTGLCSSKYFHYVIIFGVALLAHGFMLLMDIVIGDGLQLYILLKYRVWDGMYDWFMQASMPLSLYFHWMMGHLPNFVFWYRVVAFLLVLGTAIVVYEIGNALNFTSRTENLFIALISMVYPAYHVSFVLVRVASGLYLFLFFLAALLTVLSSKSTGRWSLVLRVSALLLFLVSFIVNSLLVFYYGFLALFFLFLYASQLRGQSLAHIVKKTFVYRLDFVLIPVIYWVLRPIFFPRYGLYANYNELQLSPASIIVNIARFVENGVHFQFQSAWQLLAALPVIPLAILLGAFWVHAHFHLGSERFAGRINPYFLLIYGVIWTGLAIFPYAVVDKFPSGYVGMNDRHTLLLAVPLSIVIFATVRIIFSNKSHALSRVGFALLVLCIIAFSMTLLKRYMIWEGRWITHAAIIENLERMDEAADASIYWVTYADGVIMAPFGLTYSEWSGTLKDVWGGETRTGLNPQTTTLAQFVAERRNFFINRRHLSEFDPAGCQAMMTIQPGFASQAAVEGLNSRRGMILSYLYHKFVLGPEATEQFLLNLTDVWVEPIAAPEATNCTTTARERQQQTIAIYNEILEFKPQWADAYYRRGLAYHALGQPAEAVADFTQAIELRPDFAPAYYERGLAYTMQGDTASARADYQQVLELSTDEELLSRAEEQLVQPAPLSEAGGAQP